MINERDITQSMLNTMHDFNNKSRLITENTDQKIELQGTDLADEEKKFRSIISPRVEFNKLIIYPQSSNVEWSGKFTDSNLEWTYSLDDSSGVYISGDLVRLSDNMMVTLKKLVGYYTTWSSEWANKLPEEYKSQKSQ